MVNDQYNNDEMPQKRSMNQKTELIFIVRYPSHRNGIYIADRLKSTLREDLDWPEMTISCSYRKVE